MNRRAFVTGLGAVLAGPVAAEAQQAEKVWRIGVLTVGTIDAVTPLLRHFDEGLRDLGYVEGRNIIIERRSAGGRLDKLPELAAELVRLRVDWIVAPINPQIAAAKQATSTIPIVMVHGADPVEAGYIASLAHPGGNVTGFTFEAGTEMEGKRLEILKEIVPGLSRVAILRQVVGAGSAETFAGIEAAARRLGVTIDVVDIRVLEDFESAFKADQQAPRRLGRLWGFVDLDTEAADRRLRDQEPASHNPLPQGVCQAGFLVTYGPNLPALYRRAATYVDRILKGARPADLPVEQPTTFELVINLKTAKALGLTIPPSLLLRADHVIE
jgi:putative ABC transport system substrate-binding protein